MIDIQGVIIAPLIAAGSLGLVNYYLLDKLDIINISHKIKDEKRSFLVLFSAINYFLFILVQSAISLIVDLEIFNDVLSFVVTLFISCIITYQFGPKIGKKFNRLINKKRENSGLSFQDSKNIKQLIFNLSTSCPMYIYDFENNLIWAGYSGWFNTEEELELELSTIPFNSKPDMLEYNELLDYIENIDVESKVYINVDKKIKIIFLVSWAEQLVL